MAAGRQARSRESREKYQGRSRPLPPAFSRRLLPRAEPAEMGAWGTRPTRQPLPQREAGLSRAGVLVGDPGPSKVPPLFLAPPPTYTHTMALHLPGEGRTGPTSLTVCSLLPVIRKSPSHSEHFSSELIIKPQGTCLPGLAL